MRETVKVKFAEICEFELTVQKIIVKMMNTDAEYLN